MNLNSFKIDKIETKDNPQDMSIIVMSKTRKIAKSIFNLLFKINSSLLCYISYSLLLVLFTAAEDKAEILGICC